MSAADGDARYGTLDDIVLATQALPVRPAAIGISGFGGSGKSTLARALEARVPGAYRLRGDDFLDPARSHVPSGDWDGVDRDRLATEVLRPFRAGAPVAFRRYDWTNRRLGSFETLPDAEVLVIDLVGFLHPEITALFDLTVWVDVGLDEATARGIARDRARGADHDKLWHGVWVPNERAFHTAFRPDARADLLWRNPSPTG